ncbi:hypothetical protein OG539_42135 [Actinacidiphila glaucinigra]|uniref:hypothetical protein n=1 Tax=Actinacidiphila glaucinigra TaxID=235986 RepID=UPI0032474215
MNTLILMLCPSTAPELKGQAQAGHHGVAVSAKAVDEGVEGGQVVAADPFDPLAES